MLARVTIIGRPNVWKSSIFNSLSGHRIAIISDIENTTRDIIEYHIDDNENEVSYMLADSGGIVQADNETLLIDVRARVDEAIEASDLILFVLEYDRMTDFDEFIVKKLRRSKKPVLVVANKADNPKRAMEAYQHLSLWLGDVIAVSAVQTRGFGELRAKVGDMLKILGFWFIPNELHEWLLRLAIIGRPNVGKSSLVNAIAWQTRSIVFDMPGTTRDAIDTVVHFNWEDIVLIDTAGIRRAGKIGSANIEQWSVMRAEKSVERSDVVAVVIDAFEGIAHQDEHIVGEAMKEKKWIILVINKWDKVMNKPGVNKETILERYMHYLSKKFDFLSYAPVVFTTAIENKRIDLVLEHAIKIRLERNKRVKTWVFNKFLEQITYDHAPTGNRKSHKPRIYYGSQVDVNPPKFMISVNNSDHFHFSYVRYIENKIREVFWFEWTPIEIELRSRKSMFKPKEQWWSREDHFGEEIVELEKKIADKKVDTFGKKKPRKKR